MNEIEQRYEVSASGVSEYPETDWRWPSANASNPTIGLICGEREDEMDIPGSLRRAGGLPSNHICSFAFETIDPAWSAADMAPRYREAAKELADRGVSFVATDCGGNLELAGAIKEGCGDVPSLPSVLCALPMLTAVFPKVGIVSVDASRLRERILAAADLTPTERNAIRIEGVAEDGPWNNLQSLGYGKYVRADLSLPTTRALEDELVSCGDALVERDGVVALVLDCAYFLAFTQAVQIRCGVPAFGLGGLVHYLTGHGIR